MSQNLKMDPVKRDYVLQNGSPVPSDRIEEASYFALQIPLKKWLYGEPGQGSLLYTLAGTKRGGAVEQNFSAYAQEALQTQVIAPGKATQATITNIQATPTGTSNNIAVVPNQSQLSNQLDFQGV